MVRAGHLTAEAIVRGLEAGDSYSSTGVTLDDVTRSGDEIRLQIRGVAGVTYKTQFIATMRDAPLDSERITDKDGAELTVTRRYSPAIGQIVAEVDGLSPKYEMTGKELYVRAKIVSSKPHPNPYAKGDVESAWTQPVVP